MENLATLSPGVIVFVAAMAGGMVLHELWQRPQSMLRRDRPLACAADG